MKKISTLIIILLCLQTSNLLTQSLTDSLKLHYTFENNVLDSTPNQDHLLANSQYSFEYLAPNDRAIYFNGQQGTEQISTYDNTSFNEVAISFWFKAKSNSSTAQYIIQGASMGTTLAILPSTGKIGVIFSPPFSNSLNSINNLLDSSWHHIVAQNDGTQTSLYVDGVFQGSKIESLTLSSSGRYYIGKSNLSSNRFTGSLNDLRVYNRILTISEITSLSTTRPSVSLNLADSLKAYYKFDNNFVDSSNQMNNLVTNTALLFQNKVANDYSLYFDGQNKTEQINQFDNSSFPAMSISLWFKTSNLTTTVDQTLVQGAFMGTQLRVLPNTGLIGISYENPSTSSLNSLNNYVDGQWHHVVAQNNGVETSLYLDGIYQGCKSENLTKTTSTSSRFYFGQTNQNSRNYTGNIDEVRIYNRILTPTEITTLSQPPIPTSLPELVNDSYFSIYPNPTNKEVIFIVEKEHLYSTLSIRNSIGQIVSSKNIQQLGRHILSLESQPAGVYFIEIRDQNNNSAVSKVIKY